MCVFQVSNIFVLIASLTELTNQRPSFTVRLVRDYVINPRQQQDHLSHCLSPAVEIENPLGQQKRHIQSLRLPGGRSYEFPRP